MAFVILSAGALTRSKPRTLSMRAVVGIASLVTLLVLAAGIAVGYGVGREGPALFASAKSKVQPLVGADLTNDTTTDNRLLIDRFGELSGRMMQLEAEAMDLAFRVGLIKQAGDRTDVEEPKAGRVAKTPPGSPAGGPLLNSDASDPLPLAPNESHSIELDDGLEQIESSIERITDLIAELDRTVVALNLQNMARPGREPVRGRAVVSSFGNRIDPFTRKRAFHSGIDYPAPTGTPIHASAGGRIIFAGYRRQYGNTVEVDHGGGLVTRYAHASKVLVKVGQVVMPGELIAKVGSTGRSTGPHLHFEILRDGRFVDPKVYLAQF